MEGQGADQRGSQGRGAAGGRARKRQSPSTSRGDRAVGRNGVRPTAQCGKPVSLQPATELPAMLRTGGLWVVSKPTAV